MKILILLAAHLAVAFSLPTSNTVVDGEYLIRLDEELIRNTEEENRMIVYLEQRYDLDLVKSLHLGKLKLLHVKVAEDEARLIEHLPMVKYVEANHIAHLDLCTEIPSPGTWGLDRIDQRERLTYEDPVSEDAVYAYGEDTGAGGVAYVLDSGIDINNTEFEGRARWGFTANDNWSDDDGHGHGTHCAGTIGSKSYGVAKEVELVAVKVLNKFGYGTEDGVIRGMMWILEEHREREKNSTNVPKSVVNISLGFAPSVAIDDACEVLYDGGIVVVSSAGNDDDLACGQSPARSEFAFATGASSVDDVSTYFSNFGSCVTLYAPGQDVLSTVLDGETAAWSGTSMASPHVVGAVARYQSRFESAPTPAQVLEFLETESTPDALTWYRDEHSSSPNLLLYSECPLNSTRY